MIEVDPDRASDHHSPGVQHDTDRHDHCSANDGREERNHGGQFGKDRDERLNGGTQKMANAAMSG